ncbi:glycosyltransferase family 4 protein [Methanolobus sp.]|uniref:glycosyltransferase family 4 protein n=1 Tax=Methanolobus sp. TaxID=1874737 RepID=UPI0025DA071C|nr:glycosyltransferase family 4 protein [Methanolobus sp.]
MSNSNNKKCLLSICDISSTRYGSFEEFLVLLTEKLSANNFQHIVVFRDRPIASVEEALLNHGAKIEVFKPFTSSILNFLSLYSLFKTIKPDIVHFHFYPIYSIVNYLYIFFDIKIVYTDHMGGKKSNNTFKRLIRRIYYYTNFMLFNAGIDRIICVSEFVKRKYAQEYGINNKKLVVIYNGVNVAKFCTKDNTVAIRKAYSLKSEPLIACIGLRRDKGPHYLIKAAPLILKKVPSAKFLFIGDGDCKKNLESMIETFNIKDRVIFMGKVLDLSDIYSISSVVVIPSIFEEAFCFVAAEAMACKSPVVAFDSGAIKDVLYDKNYIVSADYNLLASKVVECLKKGTDIEAARNHVKSNFSLESNVVTHLEMYDSLL